MTETPGVYHASPEPDTPRTAIERMLSIMSDQDVDLLIDLCNEVMSRTGFGDVVLEFMNGHIYRISITRTYKADKP